MTALILLSCAQGCKWGIASKIPKEELLGVLCLVLISVLILMLAVAVVLVLVLILCGNQIGRAASIPVFGIDVDIDVSAGAGVWRW